MKMYYSKVVGLKLVWILTASLFFLAFPLLAQNFTYEALTPAGTSSNFIAQANVEGAKGFEYVNDYAFDSGATIVSIYVKGTSPGGTFTYEALTPAGTSSNFIAQANAEGAKGFEYVNDYAFDSGASDMSIYVKGTSPGGTFTYEALTPAGTSSNFIAQADTEGAKGFEYVNDYAFDSGASDVSIYVKGTSPGGTFTYEALTPAGTSSDFVAQANAEGAKGFEYVNDYAFDSGTSIVSIYVKGTSPGGTFTYEALTPAGTSSDFITQANAEGARGFEFVTDYAFGSEASIVSIYMSTSASSSTGSLSVTLTPAGAINAGAQWQVDGGMFHSSGTTISGLSPGTHSVAFKIVSGWIAPASKTVSVIANQAVQVTGVYVVVPSPGSLQVTIAPATAIAAGALWQVDGGTFESSGATVAGLSAGNHTVNFNAVGGWTTPANQTVSVRSKQTTKAKGTYAFSAKGVYNGLFYVATGVTEETAGMLNALTIGPLGTYSGKLLADGNAYSFTGAFNAAGQASNHISRDAKLGGPLTLEMTLNWNDSPPTITGTVYGTNGTPWVANLNAELPINSLGSAEYTGLVSPVGIPPGYGYILITNHAGTATLSGALADGTSFSQTVPVSSGRGLPVYCSLYGNTGLLLGLISLEGGSPTGTLEWIKKTSRTGVYPSGFTNIAFVQGSPWSNPSPHTAAINLPNGQLDISGGILSLPLSFNVALSNNNALAKLPGSATNSLIGSINPKTGLLTITFGNGVGKATTAGKGAVLQNTNSAAGFFLGKTNAGTILLRP
jgi:hypothetical protein